MRATLRLILLMLSLACLVPLSGATGAPPAPSEVAAVHLGGEVGLSWSPVEGATYRVYGLQDGAQELLTETSLLMVALPPTHALYGVSAVLDGLESTITVADWCATITPVGTVPPVIIHEC